MLNLHRFYVALLGIVASVLASAAACADETDWQQHLSERLPQLGHRNWIVIADAAYPLQSREGIETIATGAEQLATVKQVLAALSKAPHVRPIVHLDAELPFVAEQDAPGITTYRNALTSLLANHPKHSQPHEEIIGLLDKSAQTFHVLILKTNLRLPYTSVFIELDCGYWSPEAERRLRDKMQRRAASPMDEQ
jgi:hypothetical protein